METISMLEGARSVLPLVVDAGWKGIALLFVLIGVSRLLRGAPAATRHVVWSAGLVALLALPFLSVAVPWQLEILPTWDAGRAMAGMEAGTSLADGGGEAAPGNVAGEPALSGWSAGPEEARAAAPAGPRGADPESDVAGGAEVVAGAAWGGWPVGGSVIAALIWMAGVLLMGVRLAGGWVAARRIVRGASPLTEDAWAGELLRAGERLGLSQPVRLLRSERVPVAFTAGLVRPVIVFPGDCGGWSVERRRAVLMHELAHVRRRDVATHLVGRAVCALHWFNPLAWVAARRLRAESERACDDLVLSQGTRASEYAEHLLDLVRAAGRLRSPAVVVPLAQQSEFEGRLLAILEPGLSRRAPSSLTVAGIVAAVAMSALPLAAMAPGAAAHASEPTATRNPIGEITGDDIAPEAFTPARQDAESSGPETSLDPAETRNPGASPEAIETAEPRDPRAWPDVAEREDPQDSPGAKRHPTRLPSATRPPASDLPGASTALVAVVPALALALSDPDADVRNAAARTLAAYQDTAAVTALMRALTQDEDAEVRATAAWSLGQIESPRAVPALARAVVEDAAAPVRTRAAWAMGQIESAEAVPALVEALRDADPEVRKQAAWALGQIEDASAVPGLVGALDDAAAETRRQVVWALGQIEDPSAIDGLMSMVSDANPEVRRMALWALAEIDDIRAAPAFARALQDSVAEVRARAASGLGELDLQRAPASLLNAAGDPDPRVRRSVAGALAKIEDPASVPALSRLLRDASPEVRRLALRGLGKIGDEAAIQAMVEALGDADAEVRREAARALGRVGGGSER